MSTIETLKQALEALDYYDDVTHSHIRYRHHDETADNLRTLIEQMEKAEPVAWEICSQGVPFDVTRRAVVKETAISQGHDVVPLYLHPAIPAPINEREEFEKWWDDPLSPMGNTGPYADGTTMQWSWEAWRARAALGEKK